MPDEATAVLRRLCAGERPAADELYRLVYEQLHGIAEGMLRHEAPTVSLQATVLANDAFLKLIDQRRADWQGRAHFLAVAAHAMRRYLVDQARARARLKRGGGWQRVSLSGVAARAGDGEVDVLELEEALGRLARLDARGAEVVVCRYFGGMGIEQIAVVLGVSPRTVQGDWDHARAWLKRELGQ